MSKIVQDIPEVVHIDFVVQLRLLVGIQRLVERLPAKKADV
jgi:hypothetical protein